MAATKRSKAKRENDLVQIADLHFKGKTQAEIAAALELTQQQISYDLGDLRKRWRAASAKIVDVAFAETLARIDGLEREYRQAWNRSRQEREHIKRMQRNGNPAFLAGVMSCIEQRCKLLGLYAPTRGAQPAGNPPGAPAPPASRPYDLSVLSVGELRVLEALLKKAENAGTGEAKSTAHR